ncbi:HIT family protein [Paenibacillus mucilaginosus]|uniref:HIT family protein n=1 Tax=Paenibacillus mucilaginosus TaxID=61624 RepID=UPI003B8A73AA
MVSQTDRWVVRVKKNEVNGYHILEPKRHLTSWGEFNIQELTEMGSIIQTLETLLKKEYMAEKVYIVTISELVPHLHLHVIPRNKNSNIKGLPLIEKALQS